MPRELAPRIRTSAAPCIIVSLRPCPLLCSLSCLDSVAEHDHAVAHARRGSARAPARSASARLSAHAAVDQHQRLAGEPLRLGDQLVEVRVAPTGALCSTSRSSVQLGDLVDQHPAAARQLVLVEELDLGVAA